MVALQYSSSIFFIATHLQVVATTCRWVSVVSQSACYAGPVLSNPAQLALDRPAQVTRIE